MTYPHDFILPKEVLEGIATQGLDYLPELIRLVINTAMKAERQQYLGVAPYERSAERRDQGNGFKPKSMQTRLGDIEFAIPQVRTGEFMNPVTCFHFQRSKTSSISSRTSSRASGRSNPCDNS